MRIRILHKLVLTFVAVIATFVLAVNVWVLDVSLGDELSQLRWKLLTASLLTVVLGSLLIYRIASKISRPLGELAAAAESLGRGELDSMPPISSQDEVGALAGAFAAMAGDFEKSQRELRISKDRAEASNEAKSAFLAMMSHEIRTPLSGVVSMSDLLLETKLSDEQAHYCRTISDSSESLLTVLNDILDLSKLDAGQLAIEIVDADIPSIVDQTVNLFAHTARSKGLDLAVDIDIPSWLHVRTDVVRIRQVLSNLVSNAIKFTDRGQVQVSALATDVADDEATIRFEVSDTGIGMDAGTLTHVFEAFRQADNTMARRFGGTGLGLAISKKIVDLLDSDLKVESSLDQGSRFWFHVVMDRGSADGAAAKDRLRPIGTFSGLTALLAEDNVVNQEVARASLHRLGIDTRIARDGREALRLFKDVEPSFVLMDCQMPEMDGYAATRAIREYETTQHTHVPIIALTANALVGDREACLASGMDDFIAKPFELSQLQEVLLRWFEGDFVDADADSTGVSDRRSPEDALLDEDALDRLRALETVENAGFFDNVIERFLAEAPSQIAQIGKAIVSRDFDGAAMSAHTLKSASSTVGARRLRELSETLETAARAQRIDSTVTAVDLKQAYDAVATELTRKEAPVEDMPPVQPSNRISRAKRILVVDDDPVFRTATSEALKVSGFQVDSVAGGAEAERSALERRPSLILLDAVMPEMDGFETCRRFAADPRLADIPILMATGLNDQASVEKAYRCGASGFVNKPVQYSVLGHQMQFIIRANETENELKDSERWLATAQQVASLGYWVCRVDTGNLFSSDLLSTIAGCGNLDRFDKLVQLIEEQDRDRFREDFERIVADHATTNSAYRLRARDGTIKHIHQHLFIDTGKNGAIIVVGTIQDVTARRAAEERVRYLAYYDALTGLANRTYLYESIGETIKSARRHGDGFALMFVDLDGFKEVNDTLGHCEGDALLKTIADRLRRSLREEDFLARFGGDEFCIVLSRVSRNTDIDEIASRCLQNLERDVELDGEIVQPRASIGISRYPDDGEDMSTLLRAADSAMYGAKANGKHRYEYYDADSAAPIERRFVMSRELREAFKKEEFELHYQPQIELSSGKPVAFEALVRWNHPNRGLIHPPDFVPELERLGLMDALGEWGIRAACEQMSQWQASGVRPFKVCVNIAADHFRRSGLIETVRCSLRDFALDAACLELEVTESALQQAGQASSALGKLRSIGVSVAIDDFGSGLSSLGTLQNLCVDRLKIDRMFVRDLLFNPKSAVLLGTITTLAHTLGFTVTAEGVEDIRQLQVLDGIGCDVVQGFYFAEPVSADKVPELADTTFAQLPNLIAS